MKKKLPIIGLSIDPISFTNETGEVTQVALENYVAGDTRFSPAKRVRGILITTGESINVGEIPILPKVARNPKVSVPKGPRLKKIEGKDDGEKIADEGKKYYPFYGGPDVGELCHFVNGRFELNYNDQFVKRYFYRPQAFQANNADHKRRQKLFRTLEVRGKTMALTFQKMVEESVGEADETDFINQVLLVQVNEDELLVELCQKLDKSEEYEYDED